MTFVELPGAVPSPPLVPPPIPVTMQPVRFTGRGRAYLKLLARGAVLLAVTLGIYRFWLSTDMRRFLWVNTEVDGDSLEYTGTALELLIGFLVGMAILVPLYVAFFVLALNLGSVGQFIGILGFPVLAFLGQFAIYRARRYRLTRTVFRGIRFHQGGSALVYAVRALLWWCLIVLTLGLAYPFAQASLERYKMKNTYYGNLRGRFEASGWRLFLRGLPMWLAVVGPLIAALVIPLAAIDWAKTAAAAAAEPETVFKRLLDLNPGLLGALGIAAAVANLSIMFAMLLYPVFQAVLLKWWIGGVRIGSVVIGSQLNIGTIYYSYVRFIGWSMLFSIGAMLAGGIGAALLVWIATALSTREAAEILGVVGGVALYVAVMLGYSTIYQVTVKLTQWRHAVETALLANPEALRQVTAEGTPSSALGEGLADALNVGGI